MTPAGLSKARAARVSPRVKLLGHAGPYTLLELQGIAWRLAEWAPLTGAVFNPDSALCKAWTSNKSLGTAVTPELPTDDGFVAVVLATGKILHWLGGEDFEVI